MRIVLCAALWFALFALQSVPGLAQSQNPTELPGQTSPTVPPSAGAAQEPTSGSSSEAPPLGSNAGDVEFFELRHFSNVTRVTGPGRASSFLTPGNNNGVDLNFLDSTTIGVRRFEMATVGRYTDDPRYDPEHTSLQRAYFRVSAPGYEVNFGDYLVSFTRFTDNQNMKGLNIIKREPWLAGFRLIANAGAFTDRYGSLWKENIFGKPFTRIVAGVRAEQKLDSNTLISFNWSYGNDIVSSVPIDPRIGTQPYLPVHNNVFSIEARMTPVRNWDLQGEAAFSSTYFDTRLPNSQLTGNTTCARIRPQCDDYAIRLDNTVRWGAWSFSEYFTRIEPTFYAVNARQVADLQDALVKADWLVSRQVSVEADYRHTNDDLRGQNLRPRTVFQLPEVHVSFRDLPGLGNLLFDVGYRERRQRQLGFSNQVTRSPYIEVGIPISSSMLNISYEHRNLTDHLVATNNTATNDISASFRSVFNLGDWMFTPLLRYELNRQMFDRVNTGNNNRSMQAGLIVDTPKYFEFEAAYRQVGATLFQDTQLDSQGNLMLSSSGAPVYRVLPGASGYNRPSLHTAITYKIGNNENHTVTLSYDNNKNWFPLVTQGGVTTSQNFYERVLQVSVLWRFRRER